MDVEYERLVDELHSRNVATCFQGPDQLVISRQRGPVMPFRGNSFWVSFRESVWYVCTWAPTCYRVPVNANLVDLCIEFLDCGQEAQSDAPASLIERYRLTELSDDEAALIFDE